MKRRLRKEIKLLLIGAIVSQGLTHSLNAYNRHLEAHLKQIELEIEDNVVQSQMLLKSNEIEPCSTSSVKSYMDVSTITSKTSDQYRFIQDNMIVKNGFLLDKDGFIGVALGSWFGEIGTRWVFKLDSGNEIYAVKIDEKDDKHTINGCEHKIDGSVIEFVIDKDSIMLENGTNGYILNGNFNNIEWFKGNIVSVERRLQND